MLNKEKYKDELEKVLADVLAVSKSGEICKCADIAEMEECYKCIFYAGVANSCVEKASDWLNSKCSILDDTERRYLKAVIRPFRDKVDSIRKIEEPKKREIICIYVNNNDDDYDDVVYLPHFEKGKMYQNMEDGKSYTLEELEL